MRLSSSFRFLLITLGFVLSPSLSAQQGHDTALGSMEVPAIPAAEGSWGTTAVATYSAHALGFSPDDSATTYTIQFNPTLGIYRDSAAGLGCFSSHAHLPQGAKVRKLIMDFCDSNASFNILTRFFIQPLPSGSSTSYLLASSGQPGCGTRIELDLTGNNIIIDNLNNSYFLRACPQAPDNTTVFRSLAVQYQLQVSTPPLTATFSDVPTNHPFFRFVEALAASGITAGCGGSPPQFCPDAPLTRGQMAVFLATALGLHWPN